MDPFPFQGFPSHLYDMPPPGYLNHLPSVNQMSDRHHSRPYIRELAPGEMDEDETDGSHNYSPLVEEPEDSEHEKSSKRRHWEETHARSARPKSPKHTSGSFRFTSISSAYSSRLNGSVHSDSSTLQHGDGIAEMTFSSYDSNTGQQQSMHSPHISDRGYTVTRSQSSRQSAARTNRILQNLEADGLPGFERDWASRHQGRLPAQAYQGTAGYHSPGILETPSERVHAAYGSRSHGGREIPIE
ncbi:hypothetical protein CVIRNUC_005931 [Coccomyxa viridis]|uniref:Uncharacterized protein n=1 Tax=Coccomyxa viridis TaxID=1274662 RepID=A0AAV1I7I1_9CHLO|nr:hypothetical protein CVIRNUC_005931 [Coccomyxa viridis]